MARHPRIEYEGAMYHTMARGDRGESIFRGDDDRNLFLDTLEEAVDRTGWVIHAYVLMTNHYHLLMGTPEPNLVAGMKWFQGTYTQRFNALHRLRGHVYQGRYKAVVIDGDEKEFLDRIGTYIHLNPMRSGLVRVGEEHVRSYPWSSLPAFLSSPRKRPGWLKVSAVFWSAGIERDNASGRRAYEEYMEEKALLWKTRRGRKELEKEWAGLRRGWYLGYETFRDRLLDMLGGDQTGHKSTVLSGTERREHGESRARELLARGLGMLGMDAEELANSRKGIPEKRVLAWFIKRHTTANLRWLSEELNMGHIANVSAMITEVEKDERGKYRRLKKRMVKTLK